MILRARSRNSSGSVVLSRSPARQSWTIGWLLTWSGTVGLDQPADRVDRNPQHAVHEGGVQVVDLSSAHLVDAEQDDAGAIAAQGRDHQDGGRLHVVGYDAG